MRVSTLILVFLLLVGCDAADTGDAPETETTKTPETTVDREPAEETTETTGGTTEMGETPAVERLSFGTRGRPEQGAVVAPSAEALSATVGGQVREPIRDAGAGTYLAVFWGEQPTGGYTVNAASARVEEDRVVVVLDLRRPQPGEMVTQSLTYPYAVALIQDLEGADREFVLETPGGRELGWPVQRTGS